MISDLLKVNEIFFSIQGESSFAGRPCHFIRLTGCNLRCNYCDTLDAYDKGTMMDIPQILERLEGTRCRLVEVTGGEPLLQADTPELIRSLLALDYTVLVESNGTQDIGLLPAGTRVIMDVKCPGSGAVDATDWNNPDRLTEGDEVKFVLSNREDYDWARGVIHKQGLADKTQVLFSTVHGRLDPAVLAGWILEDQLTVRLQVQLHKILWPGDAKGR